MMMMVAQAGDGGAEADSSVEWNSQSCKSALSPLLLV